MPPKLKGKGGHRPPPQQDQPDLDADIHSPDGTPQKRERSIDNSERPRKLQKTKRPRLSEQTGKLNVIPGVLMSHCEQQVDSSSFEPN